jgi:hypothetical protein
MADEYEALVVGAEAVDFGEYGLEELAAGDSCEVAGRGSVAGEQHHAHAAAGGGQAFGELAEIVAAAEVAVDEEHGAFGGFGAEIPGRGALEEAGRVAGLAGVGACDEAVARGMGYARECEQGDRDCRRGPRQGP